MKSYRSRLEQAYRARGKLESRGKDERGNVTVTVREQTGKKKEGGERKEHE